MSLDTIFQVTLDKNQPFLFLNRKSGTCFLVDCLLFFYTLCS